MRIRKDIEVLDTNLSNEEINLVAKVSDAFAHPARVAMFRFIYNANIERRSVCNKDLVEEFGYAQATVSQHMQKLTIGGLVEIKREGSFAYYFVNIGMLGQYVDAVKKFR